MTEGKKISKAYLDFIVPIKSTKMGRGGKQKRKIEISGVFVLIILNFGSSVMILYNTLSTVTSTKLTLSFPGSNADLEVNFSKYRSVVVKLA